MFSPSAIAALAAELALMLGGLALLWRVQLSPAARAGRQPPALTAWSIALPDFGLFVWCVIVGGGLGQLAMVQSLALFASDGDTRQVLAGAAFQLGMLGGCAGFALFASGGRDFDRPRGSFLCAGLATFAITLPLLVAVGFLWTLLLDLVGLPAERQELIGLFAGAKSPLLLGSLVALASIVAPITEELVFRAGIFRYLRSQPPIAVIFGTIVGGAILYFGFDSVLLFTRGAHKAAVFPLSFAITIALAAFLLTRSRVILKVMMQPVPRWAALLVPALLFGALHGNLASFPQLVALGVLFSLAYERTGNIAVPMLAHALFNLNTIALILSGIEL
jgi:hypothetical protein